jgi:hypothetical protein
MSGVILPLPQYAFMAWCSVKGQEQLYLYLNSTNLTDIGFEGPLEDKVLVFKYIKILYPYIQKVCF